MTISRQRAIERADEWMAESAPRALSAIPQGGDNLLRYIKSITEILFWYNYVSPHLQSSSLMTTYKRIIELLDWQLLLSIFRHNTEFESLFYPLVYACWPKMSLRERQDAHSLAKSFSSIPRERTLFRALDVIHGRTLLQLDDYRSIDTLAKYTCAPRADALLITNDSELYALTHTVFYLTDFGRKATNQCISEHAILCPAKEVKLINDIDILSELILCLNFLKFKSPEHFLISVENTQNNDGSWSPMEAVKRSINFSTVFTTEFYRNYHTTLLARDVLARSLSCSSEIPSLTKFIFDQPIKEISSSRSRQELIDFYDLEFSTLLDDPMWIVAVTESIAGSRATCGPNTRAKLRYIVENLHINSHHKFRLVSAAAVALNTIVDLNVEDDGTELNNLIGKCWLHFSRGDDETLRTNYESLVETTMKFVREQNILSFGLIIPLIRGNLPIHCERFHQSMKSLTLGYGFGPKSQSPSIRAVLSLIEMNVEHYLDGNYH